MGKARNSPRDQELGMGRNVALFVVSAVAALLLGILLAGRDAPEADKDAARKLVKVYAVPTDRADALRDAIGAMGARTVVPMPGQLLVSAPEYMHGSIGSAIRELSAGGPEPAAQHRAMPVTIDLWVVAVTSAYAEDDPALATATRALDAVRGRLGLGRFELQRRAAMLGDTRGGGLHLDTQGFDVRMQLRPGAAGSVQAALQVGFGTMRFETELPLRLGEWQVLALLGDAGSAAGDRPERLLLIRASQLASATEPLDAAGR
jgi:hypothetical protein